MTNPINKIEPYQIDTNSSFVFTNTVNLGDAANVKISGGSTGQVLSTDGAGNLSWSAGGGGSSTSAISPFLLMGA